MKSLLENVESLTWRDGVTPCWHWLGSLDVNGYGRFGVHPDQHGRDRAHRVAYREAFGPIPKGMCVLHSCDVRGCVNPAHLRLGSNADNVRDKMERGRFVPMRGEANGNAKLTDAQVEEIRAKWIPHKVTQKMLAVQYGVTLEMISLILRRKFRVTV